MRYLLLLVLAGCPAPKSKPMPDADPFGGACVPDGNEPLSTCKGDDGETGWCVDSTCRRGCVAGACPNGGDPTPVFNDCYCK